MKQADRSPARRFRALNEAEFDARVCNPDTLSVWFAFWGEQEFTPQYAEKTEKHDHVRPKANRETCRELSPGEPATANLAGDWIDSLMAKTAFVSAKSYSRNCDPTHFAGLADPVPRGFR